MAVKVLTQGVSIRSSTPEKLFIRRAFLFMRYFVYILYSHTKDTFYKGQTSDIEDRVNRHNSGYEKSTSLGRPWKLLWLTQKASRSEAISLETKLKNLSRKRLIQFMIKYNEGLVSDSQEILKRFEP